MTDRRGRRTWTVLLLAAAATMVSQTFGRFTYSLVLPAMQRDLDITYGLAGTLGSANLAAYLLAVVGVTWLATRWPADRMVRTGLAIVTLGIGAIAIAPTVPTLLISFILAGGAAALVWVPIPTVATSLLPPERLGLGYGIVGSGIGVGMVLASLVVGWLRTSMGDAAWRTTYVIEFAIAVVIAGLAWFSFRGLTTVGERGAVRVTAIRDVARWPVLLAGYGAYALSYSLFLTFLVAFLEEDRGLSVGLSSTMFLVLGLAVIPGGILAGRASDRWGRRPVLIVMFGMLAAPSLIALRAGPGWITVGVVMFGIVFVGIPAVISAHVGDQVGAAAFAAAWGVATISFGIGQMLGPQIGGWIGDASGSFSLVFQLAFWVAIGGGVLIAWATAGRATGPADP